MELLRGQHGLLPELRKQATVWVFDPLGSRPVRQASVRICSLLPHQSSVGLLTPLESPHRADVESFVPPWALLLGSRPCLQHMIDSSYGSSYCFQRPFYTSFSRSSYCLQRPFYTSFLSTQQPVQREFGFQNTKGNVKGSRKKGEQPGGAATGRGREKNWFVMRFDWLLGEEHSQDPPVTSGAWKAPWRARSPRSRVCRTRDVPLAKLDNLSSIRPLVKV